MKRHPALTFVPAVEDEHPFSSAGSSVSGAEATGLSSYAQSQKTHCNCIVCGAQNPISLGLEFSVLPDGSVVSSFKGNTLFQGYTGILHGGIIAALLDATMTHCLFHNGIQAVTGDLKIRFIEPVPCSAQLKLYAKINTSFNPLYKVDSELTCDKRLMAEGHARFMDPSGSF